MLASLIALGFVSAEPSLAATDWTARVRATAAGVTRLSVRIAFKTERFGHGDFAAGLLRLARRPSGDWVGDLDMSVQPDPRPFHPLATGFFAAREYRLYPSGASRLTLWKGRVYEANIGTRTVTEVSGTDGLVSLLAGKYQPALGVLAGLTAKPVADGRRPLFYRVFAVGVGDGQVVEWLVPDAGGRFGNPDLPRLVVCFDPSDPSRGRNQWGLSEWRVNAADGPKPEDIADPTVPPAGWKVRRAPVRSPKR